MTYRELPLMKKTVKFSKHHAYRFLNIVLALTFLLKVFTAHVFCVPKPQITHLKSLNSPLVGNLFYFFSCIFILLSRESDQCAIRARLGAADHLSTTLRWGNPAKCLSQRHKQTCWLVLHTVPSMLSVKRGSCEYQF